MVLVAKSVEDKPLAQNRQAQHNYEILETYECGIALTGTEIKSIRAGKIQLRDGFARVHDEEVWLSGVHIAEYAQGNIFNHEEVRDRKLLLHKRQIVEIARQLTDSGMTFIPLKVYLKNGFAKVLMGLAKGKHSYDKRETLRRKDQNREVERALKGYR